MVLEQLLEALLQMAHLLELAQAAFALFAAVAELPFNGLELLRFGRGARPRLLDGLLLL